MTRCLASLRRVCVGRIPPLHRYDQGTTTSRAEYRFAYGFALRFRSLAVRSLPPAHSATGGQAPVSSAPIYDSTNGRSRDLTGSREALPVPSLGSSAPADSTHPRHDGCADAAPQPWTRKASAIVISGLNHTASEPAVYASRRQLPDAMQDSLPAGWLASTGRGSNPLGFNERFQLPTSSSPGLCRSLPRPTLCMDSPPQSTTAFPTDLGCIYVLGLLVGDGSPGPASSELAECRLRIGLKGQ